MNQHINSMLEHLNLGSLRRNKNETPQVPVNDGQIASSSESDHKNESIVDTVDNKSKNIFKNLINSNDNGTPKIFQNLMKRPENNNSNHVSPVTRKSSANVVYKAIHSPEKHQNDDNNNFQTITTTIQTPPNGNGQLHSQLKRSSIVKSMQQSNGDVKQRELSPSPRTTHRKSSHDIRLRVNQSLLESSENHEMGKLSAVVKPIKTKNIITRNETFDTLHGQAIDVMHCSKEVCMGSTMYGSIVGTEVRKKEVVVEHAKDFLNQYYASIRRLKSPAHETRCQQIEKDVEATGSYHLTETELIYGAKLAWRNSSRCIGRIQWSKLQVFDCRYVTTTSGMFEALCNHIKYATNKGNIRSAITIFPQRTDGQHDYRVWNPQLILYAGYKNPDGTFVGDPMNVEFTDFCLKLGWKSKRTEFDILPLVLSANGHDPDYFDFSPDLVLEVNFSHPTYTWFEEMGLKWYAVPAVSGMLFDCGGIEFTGTAFSGWYMSTEIGCRNFCDTNRRNLLEPIAIKMGLDTRNPTSLWKDKALVEINIAVLHSFQKQNVTIVDHHTASESFMKHYENETKLRNGCPADWIWIVPPMSSSILPVFHQEMALYYLRPSFEYQESPLKTHVWKKGRDSAKNKKPRRKFHFKQIARAVKFTSKLFGRALSRRIKATVLYATETGRSEQYAKQLVELLGHAFNAQIYSMAEYDISSIEHEALLLVVASTFGNGDPPENGEQFAQELYSMKMQESGHTIMNNSSLVTSSKSFIKANSRSDVGRQSIQHKKIDRLDSLRGSVSESFANETFGPLSNVRFAVFALGSSAYPNFCSFGKYIDNILGELGGERLMKLVTGDDLCGQEQEFQKWAPSIFKNACETFCLDINDMTEASMSLKSENLTVENTRFLAIKTEEDLNTLLSKYHNKKVLITQAKRRPTSLHGEGCNTERQTILVEITTNNVKYEPGDHVGVFPKNRAELVDGILERITGSEDPDSILQLQIQNEKHTSNGVIKTWDNHERLPVCSLRTLLTRFLDITTAPTRQMLTFLASWCEDDSENDQLCTLATESSAYEDWRHCKLPHLLEVFEEFPSCKPPAALFIAQLTPLQPRFYSISSSQRKFNSEIHLTVAVVKYKNDDGTGEDRYGVCSNYLESLEPNEEICLFVRSAPGFHLPKDKSNPVILIGPGTGTAPFRGFWQEWDEMKLREPDCQIPKVWLFFGCRTKDLDLYCCEKQEMVNKNILDRTFLALSRETDIPKTYVQDLALAESKEIYKLLVDEKAHVYVCGDVTMAEHVYQTLRKIIATHEKRSEAAVEKFMLQLRDENRYHEDIFGITLRTAEIHNKSRETAKIKMASRPF